MNIFNKSNDHLDEQISVKIQNILSTTEVKPLPLGYEHELHYRLAKVAYESSQKTPSFVFQLLHPRLYPQLKYAFVMGLLFFLIPSFLLHQHHKNTRQTIEYGLQASLNLNQVGVFKFRINSPKKVEQAVIKIELPDGIKFVKNGIVDATQNKIEWCGGLDEGENIIAVYIVGTKQGNWSINTKMVENSSVRKLRVPLMVI
ncbi:MAG: hypothetical protein V1833_05680 [Elusimicrobiota bacterium]